VVVVKRTFSGKKKTRHLDNINLLIHSIVVAILRNKS
jgi:hypothetical protein